MDVQNSNDVDIKQYIEWFDNLSFFRYNPFIVDHIEDLFELITHCGKKLSEFNGNKITNKKYTNIDIQETIELAQSFFDKHAININIQSLCNDNVIKFKSKDDIEHDKLTGHKQDGIVHTDDNGNKNVDVNIKGDLSDSIVLIHELMHYNNQPNGKRNFISDMLTESISYACELILLEDILKGKYPNDVDLHYKIIEKTLFYDCYYIYPIYKLILLYKKSGNLCEDVYSKHFNDGNYISLIGEFNNYVSLKRSIVRDTWYILGIPLAIYMLEKYKDDKNFFDLILKFNDSINDKTFDECLSIIGINLSDFNDKICKSIDRFIEDLDKIYNSNSVNIIKKQ